MNIFKGNTFKCPSDIVDPGHDEPHGGGVAEAAGVDRGGNGAVDHDEALGGAVLLHERVDGEVVAVEDGAVARGD